MPVQVTCSAPEAHHLGILHRNNPNSNSTLATPETREETKKVWKTSKAVVRLLMLMVKDELHVRTESLGNLRLQQDQVFRAFQLIQF